MSGRKQSTLDTFGGTSDSPPPEGPRPAPAASDWVEHPQIARERLRAWPFQERLAKEALRRNLLVVLPTGLGKTVIAALTAAAVLEKGRGKVLFLAPTRPLVVQHARSFEEWFVSLPHAVFTGEARHPRREGTWEAARAIFATPQVILHDLLEGIYSLKDVDLIIFDEAHHARGEYAYAKLAPIYRAQRPEEGHVLALTASPGSPSELVAKLGLDGVEAREREDPEVAEYVQSIDHSTVRVSLTPEQTEAIRFLTTAAREEMVRLQRYGFLRRKKLTVTSIKDLVDVRKEIWARPGSTGLKFQALGRLGMAQHMLHGVELIEREGLRPFVEYARRLQTTSTKRLDQRFLAHPSVVKALEIAESSLTGGAEASHPKVERLTEIVRELLSEKPSAKVLVFAEYRDSVRTLVEHLRSVGISVESFVGQARRSAEDPGMSQREQVARIESFKAGKFSVLVASRVAEEGLDIPQVDLVVEYDVLSSSLRTVQRHGRTGRTTAGRVVSLVAEGTKEERYRVRAAEKGSRTRRALRNLSTR